MLLVRRNMQPDLDEYLNRFFAKTNGNGSCKCSPAANIAENDDNYQLDLAVPGRNKKDFNIDLEKEVLTISVVKSTEDEDKNYTRKEFGFSEFERSFTLPEDIDAENIKATYHYQDGILRIMLPKKEEAKVKNRAIEIA